MRFPDELPAAQEPRWLLLSELLASWWPLGWGRSEHGISPQRLDEAEKRLGKLPAALREWYCGYGGLGQFWCRNDSWLPPEELDVIDGVLVFYVENQSIVRWGIRLGDLALDDPPVVIDGCDSGSMWHLETATLSEFALQMFLHCLLWSKENRGWTNGPAAPDLVRVLTSRYRRLPLGPWSWPGQTYFLGDDDTLVELNGMEEDHGWTFACARTEAAFRRVQQVLASAGFRAEASSDEWPPGWTTAADDPIA